MAKSTIEKFIANYIRNKKISESKEGYEAWLRRNGLDPASQLSEDVGKAYAEKERTASAYSDTAQSLTDSGLLQSGYAKYLSRAAEEKKEAKISDAIKDYLETDFANKTAFAKESERLENIRIAEEKKAESERQKAEQEAKKAAEKAAKAEKETLKNEQKFKEQLIKDTKAGINALSTIDYDKAYEYAIYMGLDEPSAEKVARNTTDEKRASLLEKLTTAIISKRLTMKQAKEYALTLGLSEEDANTLAELAFNTNESVGDIVSRENYLDYLQQQINKNN